MQGLTEKLTVRFLRFTALPRLRLMAALVLVLLIIAPHAGLPQAQEADRTVIYVDRDATGPTHDGTSWATAYTTLQEALDESNADGTTDYEIWVAEGVYYPDEGSGHSADDPAEWFRIEWDNAQLYGGFAGDETDREERDWLAHLTVLSGDVDGDDLDDDGNGVAETWNDVQGNNAYHVLYLDGETYEPVSDATVIDGFAITAGNAAASGAAGVGGGLFCSGSGSGQACSPMLTNVTFSGNSAHWGGGMLSHGCAGASSPALTNVTFSGNSADERGGGMYNYGCDSGISSPMLTNVTFSGNSARSGGGMWNDGYEGISSPALTNVTFSGNSATHYGGGMYNYAYGGASSPTLTKVTFSDNSASERGGGMYNDGYFGTTSPTLTNVTFSGNSADYGGAMYTYRCDVGTGSPTLTNVTFSGNLADYGGAMYTDGYLGTCSPALVSCILWGDSGGEIYDTFAPTIVTYSIVQGGHEGYGNLDVDPLLGPLGDYGGSTMTMPLLPGSPAIDAGDVGTCPATDQRGVARPQGAGCDMGAYESRGFALVESGGAGQSTPVYTAFAAPLSVTLGEAGGNLLPGAIITFTAPAGGASIAPPTTMTTTTNASGVVSVPVTANGTPGSYQVTASAAGVAGVDFALTNTPELLSIVKAVTPSSAEPGQVVTYTLSFANNGDVLATGVVITDFLPAEIQVGGVLSSGVAVTDSHYVPAYVWQVADLAPGDSGTITITGVVSAGLRGRTVIPNRAEIGSDVPDPVMDNNVGQAGVTVLNAAPMLAAIPDQSVVALTSLKIIVTASDANGDALSFDLPVGPPGAVIIPAGVFGWTPTQAQAPGIYAATVRVTDDGLPALSYSQSFTITVHPGPFCIYLPIIKR